MNKVYIFVLLGMFTITFPNTGVFFGSGNQVIPIKNEDVRLEFERVRFDLSVENDSGLFGVPTVPWVIVNAEFHLQNVKNKIVNLQMGFPFLDLQGFGDEKFVMENLDFNVNLNGTSTKYVIKEGVIEKELDPKRLFKKVFTWKSNFKPKEKKVLIVSYKMRMGVSSLNLVRQFDDQGRKFREIDKIFPTVIYGFSYITSTAYTWTGKVDSAIFILNSDSFVEKIGSEKFPGEICGKTYRFEKPVFLKYAFPVENMKHGKVLTWKFVDHVPVDGIHFGYNALFLPLEKNIFSEYVDAVENSLELCSKKEFLNILKSYYMNLILNQAPSDSLSKLYFENNPIILQESLFVFPKDSLKISNIVKAINIVE